MVTHPDFDHYGGLIDLFAGKVSRPDRTFDVEVENLYHSGLGRFSGSNPLGAKVSGSVAALPIDDFRITLDDRFITEFLGGKTSFRSPARPFEKSFADYAAGVGKVPNKVARISHRDRFLDGYDGTTGDTVIHVLGPILEEVAGHGPAWPAMSATRQPIVFTDRRGSARRDDCRSAEPPATAGAGAAPGTRLGQ